MVSFILLLTLGAHLWTIVAAFSTTALGFVRRFPADVQVLRIERVSAGPRMRAHVTFSSMAD